VCPAVRTCPARTAVHGPIFMPPHGACAAVGGDVVAVAAHLLTAGCDPCWFCSRNGIVIQSRIRESNPRSWRTDTVQGARGRTPQSSRADALRARHCGVPPPPAARQ
jgi:hypothetical protein